MTYLRTSANQPMENTEMGLQYNFKSHDGFEQHLQAEAARNKAAKEKLVVEAENKTISYLSGQYGSAKLERESKVELTARKGAQDNLVYDGTITVFATISAGAAAKRLSLTARVAHSTVSLPKLKFISKLVSDTQAEGELREVLATTPPTPSQKELVVNLSAFKLVGSEGNTLDVYHPVYGEVSLGKLAEQEYLVSDKNPTFPVGHKGVFESTAHKALAGKSFEIKDTDGDMVQLEVGKVSGWIRSSELPKQEAPREVKTSQIALGEKVLITAELKEYYGDTITANDIVNKEATIARLNDSEIVLTVDKVAEDVVLSRDQVGVLQAISTTLPSNNPTKLEALLRSMVADRFPNNTTRFTGKFQAPEVISTFTQPQPSVEKVASMENIDMAPHELELKFKQTSGFDQFMAGEIHKVANKKRSLEEKASSELVAMLNQSYSPTRFLSLSSALDYEYDKGHTGKVSVQAEVMDSKGIKRITVEIPFTNDSYTLPKAADLAKIVTEAVSEQEKFNVTAAKEANEKCAQIDAEIDFNESRVQAALGPKAQPKPKIEKTAGVGSNQPQEATIQPVFKLNKAFLPASLKVGDAIDLSGVRYKLTSKGGDALSKGAEDGTHWTFEKLQNNSDTPASYRDNH